MKQMILAMPYDYSVRIRYIGLSAGGTFHAARCALVFGITRQPGAEALAESTSAYAVSTVS